ncbi:uncharacterized protein LTR77_009285 [Saxophila tyrrhenica]|uniref:Uncharacterized protein n=1 Tax=Saxophila tyrrhenica TaxID=1690608 RepID=A0AAV9P220_9PEZI|nr:hypothetical protein LTR77_009285 [Saxophila tyrrhenica]
MNRNTLNLSDTVSFGHDLKTAEADAQLFASHRAEKLGVRVSEVLDGHISGLDNRTLGRCWEILVRERAEGPADMDDKEFDPWVAGRKVVGREVIWVDSVREMGYVGDTALCTTSVIL